MEIRNPPGEKVVIILSREEAGELRSDLNAIGRISRTSQAIRNELPQYKKVRVTFDVQFAAPNLSGKELLQRVMVLAKDTHWDAEEIEGFSVTVASVVEITGSHGV